MNDLTVRITRRGQRTTKCELIQQPAGDDAGVVLEVPASAVGVRLFPDPAGTTFTIRGLPEIVEDDTPSDIR